jgi:molybdopterin-binding protein
VTIGGVRKRAPAFGLVSDRSRLVDEQPSTRGFLPRLSHQRTVMKISARNQFKGKILEVKKGATTAHIRLEIAPGQVITSSITNEAVDELGLKVGGTAIAVIKASNVMIAVD